MFPTSIEDTIELDAKVSSLDLTMPYLEQRMRRLRAEYIVRTKNRLTFKGQMGIGPYGLLYPLCTVGGAIIEVLIGPSTRLHYRFSTKGMAITNTVLALIGAFFIGLTGQSVTQGVAALVVGWLWLVAGNYWLTQAQVESAIRGALTDAASTVPPPN